MADIFVNRFLVGIFVEWDSKCSLMAGALKELFDEIESNFVGGIGGGVDGGFVVGGDGWCGFGW